MLSCEHRRATIGCFPETKWRNTTWEYPWQKPTRCARSPSPRRMSWVSRLASPSAIGAADSYPSTEWMGRSGQVFTGPRARRRPPSAFGRPSVQLQERADHPTIRGIIAASGSGMIPGQGAIPVIRDGVVEGPVGWGAARVKRTRSAPRPPWTRSKPRFAPAHTSSVPQHERPHPRYLVLSPS